MNHILTSKSKNTLRCALAGAALATALFMVATPTQAGESVQGGGASGMATSAAISPAPPNTPPAPSELYTVSPAPSAPFTSSPENSVYLTDGTNDGGGATSTGYSGITGTAEGSAAGTGKSATAGTGNSTTSNTGTVDSVKLPDGGSDSSSDSSFTAGTASTGATSSPSPSTSTNSTVTKYTATLPLGSGSSDPSFTDSTASPGAPSSPSSSTSTSYTVKSYTASLPPPGSSSDYTAPAAGSNAAPGSTAVTVSESAAQVTGYAAGSGDTGGTAVETGSTSTAEPTGEGGASTATETCTAEIPATAPAPPTPSPAESGSDTAKPAQVADCCSADGLANTVAGGTDHGHAADNPGAGASAVTEPTASGTAGAGGDTLAPAPPAPPTTTGTTGSGSGHEGNSYKAEIDRSALVDGTGTGQANQAFTITFTELGESTPLGSARIKMPGLYGAGGFRDFNLGSITASGGQDWDSTFVIDGLFHYLNLWAKSSSDYLGKGETVSVSFTATTPDTGNRGVYTFETEAWTAANAAHAGVSGDPNRVNNMAVGYSDPAVVVGTGVSDAASLNDVRNNPGDHYVQTADIDLNVDPYSSGDGWAPIGNHHSAFTGTYHGNSHKIMNLFINRPGESDVGLFGSTGASALLLDISLVNVNATGKDGAGGLAGYNTGTIQNSSVSGKVIGEDYIGGLIGYNDSGTILNSTASGNLTGKSYTSTGLGGLVGFNDEGAIHNSTASGNVTGKYNIGGLVGVDLGGTVLNSTASGNVSGELAVGGLVGFNFGGTIHNSSASGHVSGESDTSLGVGGLAGWNFQGTLLNSYASGNVTGKDFAGGLVGFNLGGTVRDSYASGNVAGEEDVGGLVGWNSGTIQNCYASGKVNGEEAVGGLVGTNSDGFIQNSYASGNVAGLYSLGGLVGENSGTIQNCYASGIVTGESDTSLAIGGLVGLNDEGTIQASYAGGKVNGFSLVGGLVGWNFLGKVENSYATGNATGNDQVGGLVGLNSGTVMNNYASGIVTGEEDIGGLVGENEGTIQNSFAAGNVAGRENTGALVGRNTPGGKIKNSYASGIVTALGNGAGVGGLVGLNLGTVDEKSRPINRLQLFLLATYLGAGWDITGRDGALPRLGWEFGVGSTWFMPGSWFDPGFDLPEPQAGLPGTFGSGSAPGIDFPGFTPGQSRLARAMAALQSVIGVDFVNRGARADLEAAEHAYAEALQLFEELEASLREEDQALCATILAVSRAAILALEARLDTGEGLPVNTSALIEAYNLAQAALETNGASLDAELLARLNAIMAEVAAVITTLS